MKEDSKSFLQIILSQETLVALRNYSEAVGKPLHTAAAELIDRGIVNAIVSTGALMAHGLVEATGRAHFRYNPEVPDEELYEQGYNRVYDTLEPETNLDDVERVMGEVLEQWDPSEILCSYKLNHAIGEYLASGIRDFPINRIQICLVSFGKAGVTDHEPMQSRWV